MAQGDESVQFFIGGLGPEAAPRHRVSLSHPERAAPPGTRKGPEVVLVPPSGAHVPALRLPGRTPASSRFISHHSPAE